MDQPNGLLTFLFTDIEGSSRLWERFPVDMGPALARHDAILRAEIERHAGTVFKTVGDAFCAVFPDHRQAIDAAVASQRALFAEDWGSTGPLRVRMGLHTGTAELRGDDFFGETLNRVARISSAGHGGQILLSEALAALSSGWSLTPLGDFHLRNLNRVERIFQLDADGLPHHFPALRTRQNLPNNLPPESTSLIGREQDLERVKELLIRTRAITLIGTGGTGKTRMAIETGRELLESYADGVWLVELATLHDAALVPEAIAAALDVREEAGSSLQKSIASYLAGREVLLVIDNCEHLAAAVAAELTLLLKACPRIRVLATSRQALHIPGETTYPLRPLESFNVWNRPRDRSPTAEEIAPFPSVRLFVERAQAVLPSFELTDAIAPDVARICWRLDGIPLAIELAAARLRLLTTAQISDRLNDQFRLLRGGTTVLPHQQTLRTLIDWSYDLLEPTERLLFHRLGVFAGGRTLEAVETVCAGGEIDAADIIDLLQQLADKSLIFVENEDGMPRYTLLESVWQYSREKLQESGEFEVLRDRHLDYFLARVREASPHLFGRDPAPFIRQLSRDWLNIRFALEHAAEREGAALKALEFVSSLERYWEICGNLAEARAHAEAVLARPDAPDHPRHYASALICAGRIAWAQDRYEDGIELLSRAGRLLEHSDRRNLFGLLTGYLGFLVLSGGNLSAAAGAFRKAEEIGKEVSDPRLLALAKAGQGSIAAHKGRLEEALQIKLDALTMFRSLGDRWIVGYSLWGVAQVALALERPALAREVLREWAVIGRELGNRWSIPYLLILLADAARLEGKCELAARVFGAAEFLREKFGVRFTEAEDSAYQKSVLAVRDSLTPENFQALWQAGRHLRTDAAMELALEG